MPRPPKIGSRYNDPFPVRLRKLKDSRKVTQEDLAKVLNVTSRQSVTGYTDGSTVPTIDKVIALAKYFDVSTDYLLGLSEVPTRKEKMGAVCDYIGLSQDAVEFLHAWAGFPEIQSFIDRLISDILSSCDPIYLSELLTDSAFALAMSAVSAKEHTGEMAVRNLINKMSGKNSYEISAEDAASFLLSKVEKQLTDCVINVLKELRDERRARLLSKNPSEPFDWYIVEEDNRGEHQED